MKSDLKAARERIRRSDQLYKKMEAEYQATIAAMQKRIRARRYDETVITNVSIVFCKFCGPKLKPP